jgi:hypothetical protein
MYCRLLVRIVVPMVIGVATPAWCLAQESALPQLPNFEMEYSTKPEVKQPPAAYSTKTDAGDGSSSQTTPPIPFGHTANTPAVPVAKEGRKTPFGNVPFGRASSELYAPVPTGPRTVISAPVHAVGVATGELELPSASAVMQNKSPHDPTEPTPQTIPIFEAESSRSAKFARVTLRALNKVTGHTTEIEGLTGAVLRFGTLEIIAQSCRASAPTSRQDYAALLGISEHTPDAAVKDIFSGWMYASSPSIMALEHPVYDITVVRCS